MQIVRDLDGWEIAKDLEKISKRRLFFLWPPSPYIHHSMFKHFTYFGETIDAISRLGFEINVLDGGVNRITRTELFSKLKQVANEKP